MINLPNCNRTCGCGSRWAHRQKSVCGVSLVKRKSPFSFRVLQGRMVKQRKNTVADRPGAVEARTDKRQTHPLMPAWREVASWIPECWDSRPADTWNQRVTAAVSAMLFSHCCKKDVAQETDLHPFAFSVMKETHQRYHVKRTKGMFHCIRCHYNIKRKLADAGESLRHQRDLSSAVPQSFTTSQACHALLLSARDRIFPFKDTWIFLSFRFCDNSLIAQRKFPPKKARIPTLSWES